MKFKTQDCPSGFADSPKMAGDWAGHIHGDPVMKARQLLAQAEAKAKAKAQPLTTRIMNLFRKK